jgi:2-keto-4-pentenoate hydratase
MNRADFDAARTALVAARRGARAIAACPPAWQPGDLGEAYRLQGAVIAELGGGAAWKIAAITPEQRRSLGVPQPIAAAIPLARIHDASAGPATLRLADFIAPKIECEIAFEFRRDLPPRPARPYSRHEVAAATGAMRLAIELVDPRWPAGSGTLAELADGFNNGALVAGARFADWQGIAFAEVDIVLTVTAPGGSSRELALGSARAILDGDPFATVVMLANAQPEHSPGLKAGDIVTTGSCSGAPRVPGPGAYRAEFTGLGAVELRFE